MAAATEEPIAPVIDVACCPQLLRLRVGALPGHHARAATDDPEILADQDASRARAGAWVRASERGVGLAGVAHLLEGVASPVLYLNGEHAGHRRHESRAREAFGSVQVQVVAGVGSFLHQEHPAALLTRWNRFTARRG